LLQPVTAEERKHKREELLAATEKALSRIGKEVERRKHKPLTATEIALKVGKVLGHYKMGKHFTHQIEDSQLSWGRRVETIEQEAKLDGIYVIRTKRDRGAVIGGRYGARLQEPGPGGACLSQFEKPGSVDSPDSTSYRRASASAYFPMHVGLLRGVASAARVGSAVV